MKLELGWLYIYIGKDGIHIEIERYPQVWVTLSCLFHIDSEGVAQFG